MEVLNNKCGNYIMPFFWQHGEKEHILREYMEAIQNCNIQAVCVESRPHPDFLGPRWWHDMDIIMDEAHKRSMKVWVLDDAHFPTGYANGALKNAPYELRKQYININITEICGPAPSTIFNIEAMSKYIPPYGFKGNIHKGDKLICVITSRLIKGNMVDTSLIDLTDYVTDGYLCWDVPEGVWRIFVVYSTYNGGMRDDYINIIDEASCRILIDTVYKPHYERYSNDFGKTFAGFFSDEPLIGNSSSYGFNHKLGKKMPLPWNKDVPVMLEKGLGDKWKRFLPVLWVELDDADLMAKIRYTYMDVITSLIEKNFSNQIGKWCEEHNVEYIGHLIEDNNQHARLGQSLGHFFRGLAGQHMAGIDDIGNQVLFGNDYGSRLREFEDGDGEFYHFVLGKARIISCPY